jgi:hypothetical protein
MHMSVFDPLAGMDGRQSIKGTPREQQFRRYRQKPAQPDIRRS